MTENLFASEQEAAVALLFAAVMANGQPLSQSAIEQLSRMLVLSSKFKSAELNSLTARALTLQGQLGSKAVIESAAPMITEDFAQTLFAMCCEILTADGRIDEGESEVLAMAALYLGLTVETMKMMLTTYLIRNRWNVQLIEENEASA